MLASRWQASSYRFFGCCRDLCLAVIPCRSWLASEGGESDDGGVGCAGVIAGKPAPTGFLDVAGICAWR
ncbi:hypothetical protein EMIT0P218_120044 [Pseudomonas sp. IT-P218]